MERFNDTNTVPTITGLLICIRREKCWCDTLLFLFSFLSFINNFYLLLMIWLTLYLFFKSYGIYPVVGYNKILILLQDIIAHCQSFTLIWRNANINKFRFSTLSIIKKQCSNAINFFAI